MKKVVVTPGCITCGTCAFTAPDVFEVTDISRVKKQVDMVKHADVIQQAIRRCPVQVIKMEEE